MRGTRDRRGPRPRGRGRAGLRRRAPRRRRRGGAASSSSASQAARAAGSLASGAGRARAAVTMCDGAQTERRPVFSAQSSSVRVAATPKRSSPSAKAQAACSMARRPMRRTASLVAVGVGRGRGDADDERAPEGGEGVAPGGGAGAAGLGGGKEDDERTHGRCRRAGADRPGAGAASPSGTPAADDLDAEGTGDAVELLDAHEGADGARVGEAAGGDPLGEGLEQVDALGGELGLDRLGDRVVGDDLVDVVVLGRGVVRDLEHDVEADALGDAVFGCGRRRSRRCGYSRGRRCGRAAVRRGSPKPARAAARRRWRFRPCRTPARSCHSK